MAEKVSEISSAREMGFVRRPAERDIDRLTLHEKNGVVWFSCPILDQFDFVKNAFSTRIGGVSEGYVSSMNLSLSRELSAGLGMAGIVTDLPEEAAWKMAGNNADDGKKPDAAALERSAYAKRSEAAAAMGRFLENHRRFAEAVGYDPGNLVFSDQTHTDHIEEVTEKDRGNGIMRPNTFHDVDGLMTDRKNVAMMTFYADCVPLYLVDPVKKAAACVHSGWRGTIAGIGTRAVQRMAERYGSDPADMVAAIGPSICRDCYEVSDDVADRFREKYGSRNDGEEGAASGLPDGGYCGGPAAGLIVYPGRPGHALLDLQEACRQNFLMAGLSYDHISVPDICTAENAAVMFSHRALKGKRGNLAAVLELV